jgi:hypothetical protein
LYFVLLYPTEFGRLDFDLRSLFKIILRHPGLPLKLERVPMGVGSTA